MGSKPIVWWALQSIKSIQYSKLVIVAQKKHQDEFDVIDILGRLGYLSVEYVFIDGVTDGQLSTVLMASEYIDDDEDLLIISSDTFVQSNIGTDIKENRKKCAGLISVSNAPGDQWSFARVDKHENVVEVAEKRRISNHASTGMYYFSHGRTFSSAAEDIIKNQRKIKGEYYIMPLYQYLIKMGEIVNLSKAIAMWDLGTPKSVAAFKDHGPLI